MHTRQTPSGDDWDVTRYLTLDDVATFLDHGQTPAGPRSGYGEFALPVRLRCAVGDDGRILTRRVYVLNYGNGGGTPYVYGRVSGERVRFYLDPHVLAWIDALREVHVTCAGVGLGDLRAARAADAQWMRDYGYTERLREDGAPVRPLREYPTSKPDDVGRLTREGRLYFAQRAGAL
ncbi:hypothetical protein KNU14_gp90 [Gordonia phage Buggaboo]|uniref:Uncharacterized protein n=1 Tax=Gordonia phage Buggaboo TaxID=2315529 RepID=A0A386KD54_9CAUD|nr:hypothetical protein KNU14_gp90 [Gordonia phage Buggaboo]AYD83282.1 hypothetical protein SEA_BUGGABOO_90 [Gordonia phage Buggaboo]